MQLTPTAQAVMLLTVSFGKSGSTDVKPLSNTEWARFATWLKNHDLEPAVLLKDGLELSLAGWMDRAVTVARVRALLGRGAALGLALEKWHRAGLWVLTRSDPEYPERLKRRLRAESPAVLFGCGNKALLNAGGIAIVGSRDAAEDDLAFSARLGKDAAAQGYSVVSGGARGIDQSAMLGALDNKGTAVGVLADSLLKSATSSKFRKLIMSGDLLLATPFNPEAGFNVGNAMSRNRYIYCLADGVIVVSSTADKGGTWNGALEGLKNAWVPLWVKPSTVPGSGNSGLVRRGALWLPDDLSSFSILLSGSGSVSSQSEKVSLPVASHGHERDVDQKSHDSSTAPGNAEPCHAAMPAEPRQSVNEDFYSLSWHAWSTSRQQAR
jgi:predicted Rossmann fold nucleotide-binding protein DprA/Smf involved in DNA uptake